LKKITFLLKNYRFSLKISTLELAFYIAIIISAFFFSNQFLNRAKYPTSNTAIKLQMENKKQATSNLSLIMARGSFNINEEIPVKIHITATDGSNMAQINLNYLPGNISFTRMDRTNSVCSDLRNIISNSESGTVSFECRLGSQEKKKTSGLVATAQFIAKGSGNNIFTFNDKDTYVISAQNQRTNLSYETPLGNYIYIFSDSGKEPLLPPKTPVSSLTHPNQATWYKDPNITFEWLRSDDIKEFEYCYNQNRLNCEAWKKTTDSSVAIQSQDGNWYFHVQAVSDKGKGPLNTFKINIDQTPPEEIKPIIESKNIKFNREDNESGIKTANIVIDGQKFENIDDSFIIPELKAKNHHVTIEIIDNAGNIQKKTFTLTANK